MRPHVPSLVLVLSSVSVAQAAAFDPRHERHIGNQNLADAVNGMLNLLGGKTTVTETMRHTITVGAAPAGGAGLNTTSAVTVTVTAPASTVTVCPGQAQGAVQGGQGGKPAAPVLGVPHGGVGVTVIPVPSGPETASPVANPPAVSLSSFSQPQPVISQSAAPSGGISTTSTLAPLPSQPGLIQPPGVSATSEKSLSALPPLATPPVSSSTATPAIVGAPISSTSTSTSTSTLGRLPGLPSSLAQTINLGAAGAAVATPLPNPAGAFGGLVGMVPIGSASTPPDANGATTAPSINVAGLTLASHLTLGDLVKPTSAAAA